MNVHTLRERFDDRWKRSPLGRRIMRGAGLSLVGASTERALALVAAVFIARILGRELYGHYGIIQSTVTTLGTIADLGTGRTATHYVARFRTSDPQRVGRIIGMSVLVEVGLGGLAALGLIVFARTLARDVLSSELLTVPLQIVAIVLFFLTMNNVQRGALLGLEAFDALAKLTVITGVVRCLAVPLGAWWGGVRGAVVGLALAAAVTWLAFGWVERLRLREAGIRPTYRDAGEERSIFWRFSVPTLLTGLLAGPVMWACQAMLVNRPSGYDEMSVYTAANQVRMAIVFLPMTVRRSLFPIISNIDARADRRRWLKVAATSVGVSAGTAGIASVVVYFCSSLILGLWGEAFRDGVGVLRVLTFSTVIMGGVAALVDVIVSLGRVWLGLTLNLAWGVAMVAFTWLWIGDGALGLAWANVAAYAVQLVLSLFFLGLVFRQPTPADEESL